ncbi:MAG: hypothetical protein ACK41P_10605 [Asticcacaulis sp.]
MSPQFLHALAGLNRARTRLQSGGLLARLLGALGLVVAVVAVLFAALFAMVLAAGLAVMALLGGLLMRVTGARMRSERAAEAAQTYRSPQAGSDGPVIEARKVGHAWVAYGCEPPRT